MISQGILEVCKDLPEDPVDYLSDYLIKRSAEVLNFSNSNSHSKQGNDQHDKTHSSNKSSMDERSHN